MGIVIANKPVHLTTKAADFRQVQGFRKVLAF